MNDRIRIAVGLSLLSACLAVSTGCITGHEAEEAIGHDKSAELEEARRLRDAGVISEADYELRKARIESEIEG